MADEVLQKYIDQLAEIAQEHMWEVIADWQNSDSYYYSEMQKEYGDEDGEIDWDEVHRSGNDYLKWNDEARRFSIDMQEAIRPSAEYIKELLEKDTDILDTIEELPYAIASNIEKEFPSKLVSDGGMSDFVRRKIYMKKDGDSWVVLRSMSRK
jgi:hypothetical protein